MVCFQNRCGYHCDKISHVCHRIGDAGSSSVPLYKASYLGVLQLYSCARWWIFTTKDPALAISTKQIITATLNWFSSTALTRLNNFKNWDKYCMGTRISFLVYVLVYVWTMQRHWIQCRQSHDLCTCTSTDLPTPAQFNNRNCLRRFGRE